MSTQAKTVDYLLDQLSAAGVVTSRKMFGEYALYCGGKVVALVCDDQLFVKPTESGRKFLQTVDEQPPYPGAKKYFQILGDQWDDADWLSELIRLTAQELPQPKPKSPKKLKKN